MKEPVILLLLLIIENVTVWLSGENNLCEVDVTQNQCGPRVWRDSRVGGGPHWSLSH